MCIPLVHYIHESNRSMQPMSILIKYKNLNLVHYTKNKKKNNKKTKIIFLCKYG